MNRVHVVAAVIRDGKGNVFIARRPDAAHQGGKLEFPGGKKEEGESRFDALKRELDEELGINVLTARPLIAIQHDYVDKHILLDVWEVLAFEGEPHGAEGQETAWMSASSLNAKDFPKANVPILSAVKLPRQLMVTSNTADIALLKAHVTNYCGRLEVGEIPHIYVRRADGVDQIASDLASGWPEAHIITASHDSEYAVHLTSKMLEVPLDRDAYSASVHSLEELQQACERGVTFVVLGAIKTTSTHPEGVPIGFDDAEALIKQSTVPVYLIGGMTEEDLAKAIEIGAQGIAGISLYT